MSELTAWRIVKARYAASAFDGEGARRNGGRWNSPGTALVYTAESRALAILEILVHLPVAVLLAKFVCIPVRFDRRLVAVLPPDALPVDWQENPASGTTRRLGDAWVRADESAVWQVPSAVVPQEANFLLNPAHRDFGQLVIGAAEPVCIDGRLLTRV